MFRHEGPARSPRANAILAGYLAFVAGFVNSGGFVLIGSFTSHVTGSVGRLSTDVARGDLGAAFFAALLVATFFLGSLAASLLLEGPGPMPRAYGTALFFEGLLLASFIFVAGLSQTTHPRLRDAEAAILCAAMGMQNSLVTRLSGAVVRTTHLTGVITDLGIEAAHWVRWRVRRQRGANQAEKPAPTGARMLLLLTIATTFTFGALLGATLTALASRWAMVAPACAVWAAATYAWLQRPAPAVD
ncbi:MAG TPA: YoaK family protein [Polyangia bacterium]